jgi:two-component system, sensor histidine kinase and response regulator
MDSILIIDDYPDNLKVLNNILRNSDYNLALALNGESAFNTLSEIEIDLILLDIMMPDISGFEFCKQIKDDKRFQDIPVIFISALSDTANIVKALQLGGVDYITKPFQAEEVKLRVKTQLKIRQQNKELIKLNANKDRFISILSHDLRGPLSTIVAYQEMIISELDTAEKSKVKQNLEQINQYTNTVYSLLEDLLEWGKVQKDNIAFEPQPIDLNLFIQDILDKILLISGKKCITIKHFFYPGAIVYADPNMLSSILRNLITNAIKYSYAGSEIIIDLKISDRNAIISVEDKGVGMSNDTINKLFDITKFNSTVGTNNEKGSGLGLILCKDFIKKHGGEIWVESTLCKGSTFFFSLPFNLQI